MRNLSLLVTLLVATPALADKPSAKQLHEEIKDDDVWGLGGGDVKAKATVVDGDETRELTFDVRSLRYAAPLTMSLVRFNRPADVSGVGFLLKQKADGDDDRYLFLPELKRSRRVAASRRGEDFMGTDFTYGDLDRRDQRNARAELVGEETLGKYETWFVKLYPTDKNALYSTIEVWLRKDNLRPLKYVLYDKSGEKVKTLTAKEMRRVDGRWFTTRSVMVDLKKGSKTELHLHTIAKGEYVETDFTVGELEKH